VSIESRLDNLERRSASRRADKGGIPRYVQRYLRELANIRRCEAGLEEPLPYSLEDLEDDRRCLEEIIPTYRGNPGWQTEAAKSFLDKLEQHIRENLKKGTD
jgi:hypothetical protein